MKDYIIEDIKVGASEGGFACGPVGRSAVASVLFRGEGVLRKWIHLVETAGLPAFYLSEDDIHDRIVAEDPGDEEFWGTLTGDLFLEEFQGLKLNDYGTILKQAREESADPSRKLVLFLIALARCGRNEERALTSMAEGRPVSGLAVPVIDFEAE